MNNILTTNIEDYIRIKTESRKLVLYPKILSIIDEKHPKKILDYGCGNGEFVSLIPDKEDVSIAIYDKSQNVLDTARNNLRTKNVDIYQSTCDIPERSFDFIIFSLVLMTISTEEEINDALSDLFKAKKEKGTVVIAVTHPCFRQYKYSTFFTEYFQKKEFYYLNDGDSFAVHIFDPLTKDKVSFYDYHWSLSKTINLITQNRLSVEKLYELPDCSIGKYNYNSYFPPYLVIVCS